MLKIKITLTRNSVCMADDLDDHTETINIILQISPLNTIMKIAIEYLPYVAGYDHNWDCVLNGKNVAVIKGNCLKITSCVDFFTFLKNSNIYFKYHSTIN